jgi:U3 small nucleolar RNA-associated protein 7
MELDLAEAPRRAQEYFNGAVPIKRARMELTTKEPNALQIRRQKEAQKAYGRGKRIPRKIFVNFDEIQI